MSYTFTKLFSSITESTVWCEPDATRLVWICMLAMADKKGRVFASIPGLANRARVSLEDCDKAITTFLSPDQYSRTPDFEGRRIEPIDGGWILLNHAKYRAIRDDEVTKEAKRNYINERRAKERVENVERVNSTVEQSRDNAEADTEAEAIKDKKPRKRATSLPESFSVSERVRQWALDKGYGNLEEHLEHFIGSCKARGAKYIDWDEALMNAIRGNWARLNPSNYVTRQQTEIEKALAYSRENPNAS